MPIVSPFATNPLADGRQSDRAMLVSRGVQRLFLQMGMLCCRNLPRQRPARRSRRHARQGEIWIVEIKSSIEDFRVDRKWPEYRLHSDRLFFATHPGVRREIFPEECGFILSDGYGAEILREAPEHRACPGNPQGLMLRLRGQRRAAVGRGIGGGCGAGAGWGER